MSRMIDRILKKGVVFKELPPKSVSEPVLPIIPDLTKKDIADVRSLMQKTFEQDWIWTKCGMCNGYNVFESIEDLLRMTGKGFPRSKPGLCSRCRSLLYLEDAVGRLPRNKVLVWDEREIF
jgi:hypothetical protein